MISPVKIWRRQKNVRNMLNKQGIIESWTVIYTPPPDFKKNAPYYVVLVRFNTGGKMVGQYIGNVSDIQMGKKVRTVLRKTRHTHNEDIISYGIKFTDL